MFYTGLYRSLLFPRTWHEVDSHGRVIHFSPYDGGVYTGPMIADLGLWDAYRTHLPLYFLLFPARGNTILQGLINAYREGGWFPKWASPGYRRGMPGTQAEIIFADAWSKNVRDFDVVGRSAPDLFEILLPAPGSAPGARLSRLARTVADAVSKDETLNRPLRVALGEQQVDVGEALDSAH